VPVAELVESICAALPVSTAWTGAEIVPACVAGRRLVNSWPRIDWMPDCPAENVGVLVDWLDDCV
jgi:hypothetical protein